MNTEKRMHPIKIVQGFIQTIKNSIALIIILVINGGKTSQIGTYIKFGFFLFLVIRLVMLIIEWSKTRYLFSEQTIHVKRGLFKKTDHEIRLERIQNIQRKTPFYFKMFGVTSLTLNTKGTGDNASITFEAVTLSEAERIEHILTDYRTEQEKQFNNEEAGLSASNEKNRALETNALPDSSSIDEANKTDSDQRHTTSPSEQRIVHFQPTQKDLFKASFLSLSFLIIIPVALTFYERLKDVMNIEQYADGLLQLVTRSWQTIFFTGIILILIAITIGIVKTYLTYGKHEISSDHERIYIQSGLINEKSISIRKGNVQAIRVHQSLIKRWLNMSEIMLISTGGAEDDLEDTQSLFPFLPTKRAFSLSEELLPAFQVQEHLHRLPRRSLIMKMIRIPWLFLIVTVGIFIFKPTWWFILPVLFVLTYSIRYFDYRNTYYGMSGDGIQFKSGGIDSVSVITTRKDIIEISVNQSFIQKRFGLATITAFNQATPVHEEEIKDIPVSVAHHLLEWYGERFYGIEVE